VDTLDSKLKDPLECARLRKVFEQGLQKIHGYALLIGWDYRQESWVSNPWYFRRNKMYLIPGDSPMGYRLPLDFLRWEETEQRHTIHTRDPFDELITPKGHARGYARKLISYLQRLDVSELESQQLGAELAIKQMGITFRVYTAVPISDSKFSTFNQLLHREYPIQSLPSSQKQNIV
jgi:hypothetical protein